MSILLIDFETTGLLKPPLTPLNAQPKVIEIGWCLMMVDGTIYDSESVMINPGEPITEEITKITGIRTGDVEGSPSFAEGSKRLKEVLSHAKVLIAHNLPFDKGILECEMKRLGTYWKLPPMHLCTVELFRHEWGRRMKLTELYERKVGKKLEQTHRALDDVMALREALIASKALERIFPDAVLEG